MYSRPLPNQFTSTTAFLVAQLPHICFSLLSLFGCFQIKYFTYVIWSHNGTIRMQILQILYTSGSHIAVWVMNGFCVQLTQIISLESIVISICSKREHRQATHSHNVKLKIEKKGKIESSAPGCDRPLNPCHTSMMSECTVDTDDLAHCTHNPLVPNKSS